jgi:hypothetical protein
MLAAIKTISPVIVTTKHARSNVDIMFAIPSSEGGHCCTRLCTGH